MLLYSSAPLFHNASFFYKAAFLHNTFLFNNAAISHSAPFFQNVHSYPIAPVFHNVPFFHMAVLFHMAAPAHTQTTPLIFQKPHPMLIMVFILHPQPPTWPFSCQSSSQFPNQFSDQFSGQVSGQISGPIFRANFPDDFHVTLQQSGLGLGPDQSTRNQLEVIRLSTCGGIAFVLL